MFIVIRVKKFLDNKGLGYTIINLIYEPERTNALLELTGQLAVPVIVVAEADNADAPKDVTVVAGTPQNCRLPFLQWWQWRKGAAWQTIKLHILAIGGVGVAALSAAVRTGEDIETVLFEKGAIGGLAGTTDWIDNYPGSGKGVSGIQLAEELEAQAKCFVMLKIEYDEETGIVDEGETKKLITYDFEVHVKAVPTPTGTDYKKLVAKPNIMDAASTTVVRRRVLP